METRRKRRRRKRRKKKRRRKKKKKRRRTIPSSEVVCKQTNRYDRELLVDPPKPGVRVKCALIFSLCV